jgi:FolB domain-containing protein
MAAPAKDIVFVRNVSIQAEIGLDSWGRPKPQPALISVRVSFSIEKAGVTDNIEDCMDYRKIYKAITNLNNHVASGPAELATRVCLRVLNAVDGERIETTVKLPKGLLQSEGISVDMAMSFATSLMRADLLVHKLVIPCIIGIGAHERPRKQPVIVDLKFISENMVINNNDNVGLKTHNLLEGFDRIFQVSSLHFF